MADIIYPDDYLPMPLMDGYGFKPISANGDDVRSRSSNVFIPQHRPRHQLNGFSRLTLAQVFEAFFRDALKDGQSWFYLKLQTPIGVKPYKARFVDIYEGPTLVAPKYWQYSATLELWERPLPPVGWGITRNGWLHNHCWISH
jgi:hypothetical protein